MLEEDYYVMRLIDLLLNNGKKRLHTATRGTHDVVISIPSSEVDRMLEEECFWGFVFAAFTFASPLFLFPSILTQYL